MKSDFKLLVGGKVCLSYQLILKFVDSESIVKVGLHRNRKGLAQAWEHIYDEYNKVWIIYDSLPAETKAKIVFEVSGGNDWFKKGVSDIWKFGTAEILKCMAESMKVSGDVERFLSTSLYSPERCGDLAKACGWLRVLSNESWYVDYELNGKTRAFEYAANLIGTQGLYGFKISNGRSLERKVNDFKAYDFECLISERFGNMNAIKKLEKEVVASWKSDDEDEPLTKVEIHKMAVERMLDLYGSGLKLNYKMVASVYNREAMEKGYPTYTDVRVMQLLKARASEVNAMRDGEVTTRNRTGLIIKRKRPSHPNQLWSLDGTTIQLYALMPNGKVIKAGYWVQVTDAATDCVIGWAFGQTETTALVLKALRMAVNRNKRLADVVQYDGAKANISSEVLDLLNNMKSIGLKAQPYNGKSKYVERVLGKVEQRYMRLMKNFVGGNITTRSLNSKANTDLLKEVIKEGEMPTLEAVMQQMKMLVEVYNHSKVARLGMSPAKSYLMPYENEKVVSELLEVALFWVKKVQPYQYAQKGIVFELSGVRYEYVVETSRGVESRNFRENHLGQRFYIRYNPDDMSRIHLYDDQDRYVAQANQKYEFEPVPTEGEMSILKENWRNRNEEVKESIARAKNRRLEQAALGNEEASFELVYKDEMNEAMAYLEATNNEVNYSPVQQQERERVPQLYDIGEIDYSKIID